MVLEKKKEWIRYFSKDRPRSPVALRDVDADVLYVPSSMWPAGLLGCLFDGAPQTTISGIKGTWIPIDRVIEANEKELKFTPTHLTKNRIAREKLLEALRSAKVKFIGG